MKTQRLKILLGKNGSYDIRVGTQLLESFGAHLREVTRAGKAVVITDSNVGPLYLDRAKTSLTGAGFETFDITIPAGEYSKSIEVATELWQALSMLRIDRGDVVVGLGGGVVGDLAGFVASTYLRGIDCALIPTSLLAMVDSSVGGKTAINLAQAKNLVGTFRQPVYVAADLDVLVTLPAGEWENGFAEIAKSALVDGTVFSHWLFENSEALVAHNTETIQQAIVSALTFKAGVVTADELESGKRECLNYGHTLGHALEALSDYTIAHGRAVFEGMRFAARLGVEAATVSERLVKAQDELFAKLGFSPLAVSFGADDVFAQMLKDKKTRKGELRFVFVTEPGTWQVTAVDPDLVKIYLILWEQAKM